MGRMKRGISLFLALIICFGVMQTYVGKVSASEKEVEEQTVSLWKAEHGKLSFADSKEGVDEDTNVYQK